MSTETRVCPHFHRAVELIGRRWSGAIIFVLLQEPARFGRLRGAIPEITDRMLSERLRELEGEGIVERAVTCETTARAEYRLTERGQSLGEAVTAIAAWSHRWRDADRDCPPDCGPGDGGC
jgi:DNA-binding HxlR family transcriptional regulator